MIKEEKPVFLKIFLIIVVIFIINLTVFAFKLRSSTLTGLAISDKVYETYHQISLPSKIFLGLQWVVLIALLMGVFIKDKGVKSKNSEEELKGININKMSEKNGTDIDTLYNILKSKKRLRVSNISKLFKVKREVAMEWCKILEAGNLISFEYISAREPVAKLIEK